MKKIVDLLMFEWVTFEIWRKLFLAPRNLHAQVGRNLWHVESNGGIFICINPLLYRSIFFNLKKKLKLNFFSGIGSPEVRKLPDFWVWFSICSQNYGRITKYFGLHIWNILWLIAFFGEKFTIFEFFWRIRQFLCVYWKHNSRLTFLCWHEQLQAGLHHHLVHSIL